MVPAAAMSMVKVAALMAPVTPAVNVPAAVIIAAKNHDVGRGRRSHHDGAAITVNVANAAGEY